MDTYVVEYGSDANKSAKSYWSDNKMVYWVNSVNDGATNQIHQLNTFVLRQFVSPFQPKM